MVTAIGIAAVIAGVAGVAFASVPDSSGVIHGCYLGGKANVKGGTPLNIINNAKTSCSSTQTAISWQTGPQVLYGVVNDTGSHASFFLGGKGMMVTWVSAGVTKLSIPNSATQPVISVTAIGADSTQHCVVGNAIDSHTYDIDCYDQGNPWPTSYHVIAIP